MQTYKQSTSKLANLEENKIKLETLKENLRNLFDEIEYKCSKKDEGDVIWKGITESDTKDLMLLNKSMNKLYREINETNEINKNSIDHFESEYNKLLENWIMLAQ